MKLIRKIFIFLMMTIPSFAMDEKHKDAKEKENNNYGLSSIFEMHAQLFDGQISDKNVRLIVLEYVDNSKEFLEKLKIIQAQPFDQLYNLNKEFDDASLEQLIELEKNYSKDVKVLVCNFVRDRNKEILGKYFASGISSCALDCNVNSTLLDSSNVAVNIVAFSPDSKYVVSGLANNKLKLYDLKNKTLSNVGEKIEHNGFINSIEFKEDSKSFFTSCKNKIFFWEMSDLKKGYFCDDGKGFSHEDYCNLNFIRIIEDHLLISTNEGIFLRGGRCMKEKLYNTQSKYLDILKFHSKILILILYDKKILIFERAIPCRPWYFLGEFKTEIIEDRNTLMLALFSPCAKYILSAYSNGLAKFWDIKALENIKEISQWQAHNDSINSAKFSKDGNYLVSGSRDFTFKLWNLTDPRLPVLVRTFNANDNEIFSVDFSPDNKYIAAGTYGNGTRLWDIGSADILKDLNISQLGFIIKFVNNFSKEDMNSPIFSSLNNKLKRYLSKILELRKVFSDEKGLINNNIKNKLDDLLTEVNNNKQNKQSSSCVIS